MTEERGAAMIFGIFFAVFLISMIYYVEGLVEAMWSRERLQDAADAAAYSGAVVNARGMNLLALINLVMACVLAVLVTLKLTELLAWVAIAIVTAVGWLSGGALYSLLPVLHKFRHKVHDAAEQYEDKVDDILEALNSAGDGVAAVMPIGANLAVMDMVVAKYAPDATAGVVLPASTRLPVQDDTFPYLCNRAGRVVGHALLLPISPLIPDDLEQKLAGGMGEVVQAAQKWFCPQEDGSAPSQSPPQPQFEEVQWVEVPEMPHQRACTRSEPDSDPGACRYSRRASLESMPDTRGDCRRGMDVCAADCGVDGSAPAERCPPSGPLGCTSDERTETGARLRDETVRCGHGSPYRVRADYARAACQPGGRSRRNYVWRQARFEREYLWKGAEVGWQRGEPRQVESRLVLEEDFPCVQRYDTRVAHPVCLVERTCALDMDTDADGECIFTTPMLGPDPDRSRHRPLTTETWTVVSDVFRCQREREVSKEEAQGSTVQAPQWESEDNGDAVPFQLQEGSWLGGPDFQIRSAALGPGDGDDERPGVRLASWGRDGGSRGESLGRVFEAAGRLGLGQAEFYFDWTGLTGIPDVERQTADSNINKEWLWYMGWSARMRPFRLDMDDTQPGDASSSESSGGGFDFQSGGAGEFCADACGGLQGVVDRLYGGGDG